VRGLGTVGAILRAAACFDAEQNTALNFVTLVVLPMSNLGAEDKLRKGEVVDALYLGDTPIVPQF